MRVLVVGAGVIGRIYAARLALAGNQVALVARGSATTTLAKGIRIHAIGERERTVRVPIVTDVSEAGDVDIAFLAVRRDQLDAAIPDFARIRSRLVVSLIDIPRGLPEFRKLIGPARFIPAFPGVAGSVSDDGVVYFIDVRQQPTTVEDAPDAAEVVGLLEEAGFRTATVPNMDSWLQTHVVFITAFEAAIVRAGGDVASLAHDYSAVHDVVVEVRRGLRALTARGVQVSPSSLKTIFIRMPLWFATRYWMRQLAGPLGRFGFRPHAMKSQHTELPAFVEDVHALTGL